MTMHCHLRLALETFYLHTKFGKSRFSRSGDRITGIKVENGPYDPDNAHFRGGLLSKG